MLGAALLSAGASFLSGVMGRSDAKKQAKKEEDAIKDVNKKNTANATQMNKEIRARADAAALVPVQTSHEGFVQGGVNMDAFLKDAEKAGINPISYLRSGALMAYANTYTDEFTCTTGERAMDAALSGTYLPQLTPVISNTQVPGMGTVFGSALNAGVNQWLSDRSQQTQNDFQMAMLQSQLAGNNRSGTYGGGRSGLFGVPTAYLAGGHSTTGQKTDFLGDVIPLLVSYWDNTGVIPQGPMPSGSVVPGRVIQALNPKVADNDQIAFLAAVLAQQDMKYGSHRFEEFMRRNYPNMIPPKPGTLPQQGPAQSEDPAYYRQGDTQPTWPAQ